LKSLPGILRACLRLPILPLITVLATLSLAVCILLRQVWPKLGWGLFRATIRTWGRCVLVVMNVHVEVRGTAPVPPFFLVSNHLSYLDIPLLHSLLSGHFLSKAEISSWPIAGHMARVAGTLFVDRERARDLTRVLPEVEQLLRSGGGIVIFPEGTSSAGSHVLPFKPALFEVALRTGIEVSVASLCYETHPSDPHAGETVCWWGDMPFGSHFLRILTLKRIQARVTFAPEQLVDEDRKLLSTRALALVEQNFEITTNASLIAGNPTGTLSDAQSDARVS
jgi:1-acyl-sn-glycerol-3-phosphate acyltransferase